jgi:hypothetical protein
LSGVGNFQLCFCFSQNHDADAWLGVEPGLGRIKLPIVLTAPLMVELMVSVMKLPLPPPLVVGREVADDV